MRRRPRLRPERPVRTAVPSSRVGSLRQYDAESSTERGEVQAVDGTVAVEVELGPEVGMRRRGAESLPEFGEVQAVDRLIAVNVAEESEQVRHAIAAGPSVIVPIQ